MKHGRGGGSGAFRVGNARARDSRDKPLSKRERRRIAYESARIARQLAVPTPQLGRRFRNTAARAIALVERPEQIAVLTDMSNARRVPHLDALETWWRILSEVSEATGSPLVLALTMQLVRTMSGAPHFAQSGKRSKKRNLKKRKELWRNQSSHARMARLFDVGLTIVERQGNVENLRTFARYGASRGWGGRAWTVLLFRTGDMHLDEAVVALKRSLNLSFCWNLIRGIAAAGDRGPATLVQLVRMDGGLATDTRRIAVAALDLLPSETVKPVLREIARYDRCKSIRKVALEKLITLGVEADEIELLVEVAADGPSRREKRMALEALRNLGEEDRCEAVRAAVSKTSKRDARSKAAPLLEVVGMLGTVPIEVDRGERFAMVGSAYRLEDQPDTTVTVILSVPAELAPHFGRARARRVEKTLSFVGRGRGRGGGRFDPQIACLNRAILHDAGCEIGPAEARYLSDPRVLSALCRAGFTIAV